MQRKNISSRSDASESAYTASDNESIEDDSDIVMGDIDDDYPELQHQMHSMVQGETQAITQSLKPRIKTSHKPSSLVHPVCSLCGERHGDGFGECPMTDSSQNLAEYRELLILHADDEPWETRVSIGAFSRNCINLIHFISSIRQLGPLKKFFVPVGTYPSLQDNHYTLYHRGHK